MIYQTFAKKEDPYFKKVSFFKMGLGPKKVQKPNPHIFGDIPKDGEFLKVTNSPDSGLYVNPLFLM